MLIILASESKISRLSGPDSSNDSNDWKENCWRFKVRLFYSFDQEIYLFICNLDHNLSYEFLRTDSLLEHLSFHSLDFLQKNWKILKVNFIILWFDAVIGLGLLNMIMIREIYRLWKINKELVRRIEILHRYLQIKRNIRARCAQLTACGA